MISTSTLFRIMSCISLVLFILAVLSPWVGTLIPTVFPYYYSGEDIYWSFQAISYIGPRNSWECTPLSWNFWFGPNDRLILWNFWFSQWVSYHGLTFDWIHLFILQMLTVFSGIYVLTWRWKEITYMLVFLSFSILSTILGLEIAITYCTVRAGYTRLFWGLPLAVFSTLLLLATFLIRYLLQKYKKALSVVSEKQVRQS
jgi:hypothetical protein